MKLLEIKNNLVKMSYEEGEDIRLAEFTALVEDSKSYVAQIVNLKSDETNNYAIAKLIFTFNKAGMVDNYDGTIPTINANVSVIDITDILKLIPVERPVIIGKLAQHNRFLKLDETIFENNLTICAEKFEHISTTIKNAVSQISKNNEKIIVIDTDHNFVEYQPIKFKRDFKLPLNYDMINYIYDNDLSEIEPASKAVIQDIFFNVQEYAKTAKNEFIPFDTFLNVVNQQYKETDMPELALLKNRLLKYQEQNIFAQTNEEVEALEQALKLNSIVYIDISDTENLLQQELIRYIHETADKLEAYVYNFVKLTNNNSDKKLLKQLLNNEHIFTSIICSHSYKYISELKQRSDNMILFAPQTVQHDFASYNTLLNKLNANEFIVYGELTQNTPFIIELTDFENEDFTEEILEDETPDIVEDDIFEEEPVISERHDDFVQEMINDNFDITEQNQQKTYELEPDEIEQSKTEPDEIEQNEELEGENLELEETENQEYNESMIIEDTESLAEEFPQTEEELQVEPDEIIEENTEEISVQETPLNFNDEIPDLVEESLENEQITAEDNFIDEEPEQELIQDNELPEQDENVVAESDKLPEQENILTENDELDYSEEENLPVYPSEEIVLNKDDIQLKQGDNVRHAKYGQGVIEKIIKYGNKTLCSISFEEVGRRLLDPSVSALEKLS